MDKSNFALARIAFQGSLSLATGNAEVSHKFLHYGNIFVNGFLPCVGRNGFTARL